MLPHAVTLVGAVDTERQQEQHLPHHEGDKFVLCYLCYTLRDYSRVNPVVSSPLVVDPYRWHQTSSLRANMILAHCVTGWMGDNHVCHTLFAGTCSLEMPHPKGCSWPRDVCWFTTRSHDLISVLSTMLLDTAEEYGWIQHVVLRYGLDIDTIPGRHQNIDPYCSKSCAPLPGVRLAPHIIVEIYLEWVYNIVNHLVGAGIWYAVRVVQYRY
jgi:hypothetical protein